MLTDTLFCPFCEETSKFEKLSGEHSQLFRCMGCHKPFLVNTEDVIEKTHTQIYDMPDAKVLWSPIKKENKIGKKR